MKMEKILQSIVWITACVAFCGGVPQVLLESNPDTSVPVCPDVPLVFTCTGTELGVLRWFRDGTQFFSIANDGSITLDDPPDGLQVVVNRNESTGPTTTDFTLTLTVDNATLVGDSEICCGLSTSFDNCTTATLIATSPPNITSIREETVRSVRITLEGSECFVNYTIQYEGRSISTGGALSVLIEDVVFCQQPNITFNVTAVLRDDSLIDGSESADFTLTGETLGRITGVNVTGPGNITIEWMEPDFSYGCVEKYDITKSNGDSSPCENSPYVCEECRCKERELTVIPVLRNGIRVENSRSDPVIVGKDFPVPNTDTLFICSEKAEVIMFLQPNSLSEYPDGTIEVTYSRDGEIRNTSRGPSVTEICCELDYREFNGDEVVFNVTFRGGGVCEEFESFSQTILNVINRTEPDFRRPEEAQELLTLNDCTRSTSICPSHLMGEMMINYTYVEIDTENVPVTAQVAFPEDSLQANLFLTALDPETNYSLTVEVVIVEGGMIGVECNDTLKTTAEADSSSVSTGLIVGDGVLALIYIIAVVVAVVLILLTWWKHRTSNSSLNLDTLLKELKEVEGDWKQLGECLGVSPSQLDEIAKQCSTAAECMVEMLDVWIKNHVGHPTWKEVIVGLGKLNHYHLAESLKHRYTTVSLRWWQLVILACGVVLLVVSIILLIVMIVELAKDIDEEVEDGETIGLVVASYIVSAVTAVLWIVLIFLAPKWITGHSLCERSVDEPDSGEKPRKKPKRKSKTAPEEIAMTDEHYGKLQHPGVVSPSSELLVDQSTYATLDMGDADVTTGQQEYAVTQHGRKPQAVLNISDPNYGHLNEGEAAQPEYNVAQHGRPKPKRGVPEVPGHGPDTGYGRLDQATRTKEYEEVSQAPRYKPRDSGRRQ